MRFGVMHDFRNPKRWHVASHQFYESMIEQVVRMEQLGYDLILKGTASCVRQVLQKGARWYAAG